MCTDAYLHPSILYGQWEGWDGKPLDQPPLFYNGLTEAAANLLSSVSDEVVKTAKVVEEKSGTDMSNVRYIPFYLFKTAFAPAQYSLSYAGNHLTLSH